MSNLNEAIPNLSFEGYQVIDFAKVELGNQCPRVISCADIITLLSKDAIDMVIDSVQYE